MSKKSKVVLDTTGLESDETLSKHSKSVVDFADRKFLEDMNVKDHITQETKSSKYDDEREDNIQNGLKILESLSINGVTVNPLMLLLAKCWEIKPARAEVKKMIDEEARLKGFESDVYLQIEISKEIDKISELQAAIDRVKYAKTYYKPRRELSTKVIKKQLNIDNKIYNIPLAEYNKAIEQFSDDKIVLKQYLISVGTVEEIDSL